MGSEIANPRDVSRRNHKKRGKKKEQKRAKKGKKEDEVPIGGIEPPIFAYA
jgi:hypothetical protein